MNAEEYIRIDERIDVLTSVVDDFCRLIRFCSCKQDILNEFTKDEIADMWGQQWGQYNDEIEHLEKLKNKMVQDDIKEAKS